MRSLILSQCRDLRVIWEDVGALITVRARKHKKSESAGGGFI